VIAATDTSGPRMRAMLYVIEFTPIAGPSCSGETNDGSKANIAGIDNAN
jgi:hypothetical protein